MEIWEGLCGGDSVLVIGSTNQLPKIISSIIGLTEGTLDITDLESYLGSDSSYNLINQLSKINIGAQAKLRHNLPNPIPKAGDIFLTKGDIWPIINASNEFNLDENIESDKLSSILAADEIEYL